MFVCKDTEVVEYTKTLKYYYLLGHTAQVAHEKLN